VLHRTVREHLETYLARAGCDDDLRSWVPPHVEQAFRAFLRCGILAHGFARAYCHGCGHDFLIAFSCKRPARGTAFLVGGEGAVRLTGRILFRCLSRLKIGAASAGVDML
jgi:hypothetical protein